MKQFIQRFSLYAAILLSLILLLSYSVTFGLRRSDFGALKEWREILGGSAQAEVLIQGSSRAWVHFDTRIIDSLMQTDSYNLGMDGAAFDIQYVRWKTWIERHPAPDLIIQHVDLDLFDPGDPQFQKYQYLPFLSDKQFRNRLREFSIINNTDCWLPFLAYMGQAQAIKIGLEALMGINLYPSEKYKGFAAHQSIFDGTRLEVIKEQPKRKWITDNRLLALFNQFVLECKSRGIKLILVYSPVYHELESVVEDFDGSRHFFARLAAEHKLEYYDFSITDISLSKTNFYNATHLNEQGATEFTIRLAGKLEEYTSNKKR